MASTKYNLDKLTANTVGFNSPVSPGSLGISPKNKRAYERIYRFDDSNQVLTDVVEKAEWGIVKWIGLRRIWQWKKREIKNWKQ